MTGERRLDTNLGGLRVPHLTDHDDIRVLPQYGSQGSRKGQFNLGLDLDLTPKLRMIMNANYLMFDETEVLQAFTFQGDIDKEIGLDLSCGFEWRPFHIDNMILLFGASALIPDEGFKDLYAEFNDGDTETLFASFCDMILTY